MRIRGRREILIDRREGARQWLLLGAFLLFFGLLAYFAPIGIYPDSGSYISSQAGREPLYPLFLMFFRFIFHEGDTITWLAASGQLESGKAKELIDTWPALRVSILTQGLLTGFSCFFLTRAVKRIFGLGLLLTALVGLCTLIPHVLTPLASSSRMVLSNAVLTEGITFPLFYGFTAFMLLGLFEEKRKRSFYCAAFVSALLLVLTRNHMLVALAVWCAVILFEIVRSRKWTRIVVLVLSVIVFLGARSAVNRIYNSVLHEGYKGSDTGSYNMLTTMLYLSEAGDAALITDEELRALFTEMHAQLEKRGMTRADAPGGILGRAYHYEDCYDVIGFEIQQPYLFGYAADKGIPEGEALNEVVRVAGEMNRELFPHLAGAYCRRYLETAASGLTRSVSASGTVMGIYSVVVYFLAAALVIYLYRKNKRSKAALLMLFALLMICANVFATALMIMCLSRYMIYNTALFYIAGLMMFHEIFQIKYSVGERKRL